MLEEIGANYELHPINILKGQQHEESFQKINPNRRIPAIVDMDGPLGRPFALFESGAILQYLASKAGKFLPSGPEDRYLCLQWLSFQIANVGPMFGQCGHFMGYAPEDIPYAKKRYYNETVRLYGILDAQLEKNEYLAGAYSIADIATYPWTMPLVRKLHTIDIAAFPNVQRWNQAIADRPAVKRGISILEDAMKIGDPTEEARKAMFGNIQISQDKRSN